MDQQGLAMNACSSDTLFCSLCPRYCLRASSFNNFTLVCDLGAMRHIGKFRSGSQRHMPSVADCEREFFKSEIRPLHQSKCAACLLFNSQYHCRRCGIRWRDTAYYSLSLHIPLGDLRWCAKFDGEHRAPSHHFQRDLMQRWKNHLGIWLQTNHHSRSDSELAVWYFMTEGMGLFRSRRLDQVVATHYPWHVNSHLYRQGVPRGKFVFETCRSLHQAHETTNKTTTHPVNCAHDTREENWYSEWSVVRANVILW